MVGSVIHRVAVIGAGMAGLVCARQLADAGRRVVVFDKSGDIGGRLATRRRDGLWWNHGAPAVHVRSREFLALLESLERRGSATAMSCGELGRLSPNKFSRSTCLHVCVFF